MVEIIELRFPSLHNSIYEVGHPNIDYYTYFWQQFQTVQKAQMDILGKFSNYLFYATNPRFIFLKKRGFSPERFQSLKAQWLQDLNINTILDIGANTGQAAVVLCEAFPQATIYSFEPLPDCYEKLKLLELNYSRFKAFNVALGETSGTIAFERNGYTPSSSILSMTERHKQLFPYTSDAKKEEVKIEPLDEYVSQLSVANNLMIKLDVQGYERQVIKGGVNIFKKAKLIIVETSFDILYEGQSLFPDTYNELTKIGFKYAGSFEQLYSPSNKKILQQDALFIKD